MRMCLPAYFFGGMDALRTSRRRNRPAEFLICLSVFPLLPITYNLLLITYYLLPITCLAA